MIRRYDPTLVTAADALVSVDEIKAHTRVSRDAEDSILQGFVAAATAYLDGDKGVLGFCLGLQTWQNSFDRFPIAGYELELMPGKVQSISSVQYRSPATGEFVTLDPSEYELFNDAAGSFLVPPRGNDWPEVKDAHVGVRIEFVSGQSTEAVPADIKNVIKLLAAHFYEHREAVEVGQIQVHELPLAVRSVIDSKRWRGF